MQRLSIYYFLFTILLSLNSMGASTYKAQSIELPYEDRAERNSTNKYWHLSLGNYFDLPSTYQVTSSGQKNEYELWPIINGGKSYQGYFYENFLFQWNILLSMPKDVGSSDLTRTLIAFDLMFGHKINYLGSLSIGVSFFQQFLYFKESGETQTEGSGDGGNFHRPSRAVLVSQQALLLAYATPRLFNHFSLEGKAYIFSLFDNADRAESYAINLMYQW